MATDLEDVLNVARRTCRLPPGSGRAPSSCWRSSIDSPAIQRAYPAERALSACAGELGFTGLEADDTINLSE